MIDTFPQAEVVAAFGQTECSPVTCLLRGEDSIRKIGSVGTPMLNVEVRVVDEDMNDVPRGEVGEIVYRGPMVMKEYWNKPEETAEAFRGGWFHSGDLVRAGRRRLPLRRRPQEGHDHLRRREHLLRRGRGRAGRAPEGRRGGADRRPRLEVRRGAAGRGRAARPGTTRRRRTSSPRGAASTWPATSTRASTRSSGRCRATRAARCSRPRCARSTPPARWSLSRPSDPAPTPPHPTSAHHDVREVHAARGRRVASRTSRSPAGKAISAGRASRRSSPAAPWRR